MDWLALLKSLQDVASRLIDELTVFGFRAFLLFLESFQLHRRVLWTESSHMLRRASFSTSGREVNAASPRRRTNSRFMSNSERFGGATILLLICASPYPGGPAQKYVTVNHRCRNEMKTMDRSSHCASKACSIVTSAFGCDATFDAQTVSFVPIEASRLRRLLEH